MRKVAGRVSSVVQGQADVTSEMKVLLGLTVRKVEPTPVGPPAWYPSVAVMAAYLWTLRVFLRNGEDTGRARPAGVAGAYVWYCVSEAQPGPEAEWVFAGYYTKTTLDLNLPETTPGGATVWVSACWYSTRAANGPRSPSVAANIPGGSAAQSA